MNFEMNEPENGSLKDRAARKLGLDPKTSSINSVQAAMLGLPNPEESSVAQVEDAISKLSPDKQLLIDTLDMDQWELL